MLFQHQGHICSQASWHICLQLVSSCHTAAQQQGTSPRETQLMLHGNGLSGTDQLCSRQALLRMLQERMQGVQQQQQPLERRLRLGRRVLTWRASP